MAVFLFQCSNDKSLICVLEEPYFTQTQKFEDTSVLKL